MNVKRRIIKAWWSTNRSLLCIQWNWEYRYCWCRHCSCISSWLKSPCCYIPGGYSTLVWVGVCRWDFWNATHPCTHFGGKVTHPCTKNQNFSLKFAPFWRKFRKILKSWPIKVPNLRHFGANFRKFWKIDPSKYHVFEKKKDPLMYLAAWFCYPCLRHIPITTFVLSTPPGCYIGNYCLSLNPRPKPWHAWLSLLTFLK